MDRLQPCCRVTMYKCMTLCMMHACNPPCTANRLQLVCPNLPYSYPQNASYNKLFEEVITDGSAKKQLG